jgi:flagellar basal-body rod modification protein FlgD
MDVSSTAAAAAAQSAQAKKSLSGNFDTFLTLLTTQLKNQDPLSPMDSTKFTEQLVSYSQVEQQINTNDNLKSLLALTKSAAGANAVSYLGKTALTSGANSGLQDGTASWRYSLPSDATSSVLSIVDGSGKVVRTIAGEKNTGVHELTWDGKNDSGIALPQGTYKLLVNAKAVDGTAIDATISGVGLVKEIDMSQADPILSVSGRLVALSEILGLKNQ